MSETTEGTEKTERTEDPSAELTEDAVEEFGELARYTAAGFLGGLALGFVLDRLGLGRSGLGQWAVRTVTGEGESLLEGFFALRRHLSGAAASLAQAYGWGKLAGMAFPWLVDGTSRLMGVDVYGVPGFYIPFFYAMSDQIGGGVSGFLFLRSRSPSLGRAVNAYLTHPVMLTGLVVVLVVPVGLALARLLGFEPGTQVLTALETMAANLCWLPPLVGWWSERRKHR
ncbi:MAG: hypothetical protein OES47_07085 [Acidobacteriota bacterium]|nr:hypothetical protein [Acidobacteriota bacterium]